MDMLEFLEYAKLEMFNVALMEQGYSEVLDLQDADDGDFVACGMKPPEVSRLKRKLKSFLTEHGHAGVE